MFQLADHLLRLSLCGNLGLRYTRIECQLVGGIGTDYPLEGLVGFRIPSESGKHLPEKIQFSGFLFPAHFMLDDPLEIRDRLAQFA